MVFSSGAVSDAVAQEYAGTRGGIRGRAALRGKTSGMASRPGGRVAETRQTERQSMAATRHRSTARRFVRSACPRVRGRLFRLCMPPIVKRDGGACHRRVGC
ncbi:hypothetical protein GCM10010361_64390 [Streptomyces olivaceiscleroticus]|uniref:Uncharacterized protein n=1 Tax=Streptomyces olivaceiscleroticus TaxID=68245 RepID=A0ABN1B4Q3_9ACTN